MMMKSYLAQSAVAIILLTALVAIFDAWVDPFTIYRFQSADAQRISRANQTFTMRLSKPWQVAQQQPQAVVIGSSRSATIHPSFASKGEAEAYNFSMPGLTMYEMLRLVQHAHAHGPLNRLMISLEYETFILQDYKVGIGFVEDRLSRDEQPSTRLQLLKDIGNTLLTGSALTASLLAINNHAPPATMFYPDGSWENNSDIWLGKAGYVSVARHMRRLSQQPATAMEENLEVLQQILRFCYRNNIDTRIVISPEHLFITDFRADLGKHEEWQEFHRQLVQRVEVVASTMNRAPFPVWGFSHWQRVVNEPLQKGLGEGFMWFRDGIHFHPRLGRQIQAQVWGDKKGGGSKLDSMSLPAYLLRVDTLREKFRKEQAMMANNYRGVI